MPRLSIPQATAAIRAVDRRYEEPFLGVVRELNREERLRQNLGGRDGRPYLDALASKFVGGRRPRGIPGGVRVTDPAVGVVLRALLGLAEAEVAAIVNGHVNAMRAENWIGQVLEEYLATQLEPAGWIWCSGTTVQGVDFLNPRLPSPERWLQIKTRDNSETGPARQMRRLLGIPSWYRISSRTGLVYWNRFPLTAGDGVEVGEDAFQAFLEARLEGELGRQA